ncbi:hypothetical protein Bbelb_298120 [Branchiostoma belcheri]|nr:hypothetical protein Bbelb_298120 [Branchiostoma belcheri]
MTVLNKARCLSNSSITHHYDGNPIAEHTELPGRRWYVGLPQVGQAVSAQTQSCDFETDFCGWTQATDDQIDWFIERGPTAGRQFGIDFGNPGLGSGPIVDHTFGNDVGGYATFNPNGHVDGDRARLVSQEYTNDVVLRFWYHLFGQEIFVNVYLEKGGTLSPIFNTYASVSADDIWKPVVLPIVAQGPYKIVFETGRDGSFRCQAAIDDVTIIMCGGVCEIPPAPRLDCNFDRDLCGFQQDITNDDLDWTKHNHATPNRLYAVQNNAPGAKTGPFHDHTLGQYFAGYYMYIESSTPAQTGDVARLFSPETSGPCLEFYFHMFGIQMGTLQVYTRLSGSTDMQLQWELSGDRGDTWNRAVINHNITDNYQVIFHGDIGGFLSDIAIDDVTTWNETCEAFGGWGDWGNWTDCTTTCGGGIQNRTRYCDSPPPPYGFTCVGDDDGDMADTEQQDCNKQPCPVDGGWGPWHAAGDCNVTCGRGTQPVDRQCDSPAPQYGGSPCAGPSTDTQGCDNGPCPIDGEWGQWSGFSACNVTCGGGVRLRTRLCDNPPPQHGGDNCVGDDDGDGADTHVVICNRNQCPVDGGWSQWLPWETCSQSCGGGTQRRVRTCTEPAPQYNGNFCQGDTDADGTDEEFQPCQTQTCPVDGGWGVWTSYGACSATCGAGVESRSRRCDSPAPSAGGKDCPGDLDGDGLEEETRACHAGTPCPVDGQWGQWHEITDCNVTCGGGMLVRERLCDTPSPQHGGNPCAGDSDGDGIETGYDVCKTGRCPDWGAWGSWSACTASCGPGDRERARQCDMTGAEPGATCPGDDIGVGVDTEEEPCNNGPCPEGEGCGTSGCPEPGISAGQTQENGEKSDNTAVLAGAACGGIGVLLIAVGLGFLIYKKKQDSKIRPSAGRPRTASSAWSNG